MPPTRTVQSIDQLLPKVGVGERFEIQPRSRIGKLRVRGVVTVERREAGRATIAVACRVFGVPSQGRIEVDLDDDGAVTIEVHGLPFLAIGVTGEPLDLERDRFLLDIDPGEQLEVTHRGPSLEIHATGLRVGTIHVELVRLVH